MKMPSKLLRSNAKWLEEETFPKLSWTVCIKDSKKPAGELALTGLQLAKDFYSMAVMLLHMASSTVMGVQINSGDKMDVLAV